MVDKCKRCCHDVIDVQVPKKRSTEEITTKIQKDFQFIISVGIYMYDLNVQM